MTARSRLPAAFLGFGCFVWLGLHAGGPGWPPPWWLVVGAVMVIGAVFVEPFFTRPQDAIANAVGGLGAYASADRSEVEALWLAYLILAIVLLLAGLVSALTPGGGKSKWVASRVSMRLGRAVLIGGLALSLEVVGRAARGDEDFELLGLATAGLLLALAVDWSRVFRVMAAGPDVLTSAVVGVVAPSAMLVSHQPNLVEGASVDVRGSNDDGDGVPGWVARKLAHSDGSRYELVLAGRWDAVVERPGDLVEINRSGEGGSGTAIGAVLDGSDDMGIRFQPVEPLSVGQPVAVGSPGGTAVYQVTSIGISHRSWESSRALVYGVQARCVGQPDGWRLTSRPSVPRPHALIEEVALPPVQLPDTYCQVGTLKGTTFPIGLDLAAARRSHVAILGMSGMGKTSVAHRLAMGLGQQSTVVAVDVTGEYSKHLGSPSWDDAHISDLGFWVWEPQGEPPKKAREIVERFMKIGADEYLGGTEPSRRVLFFEEAHALIPEWNFAPRHHQDAVNYTTRMVMQSRKYGLTFVIVSQRTAVVSKSALSQCENYVVLRTIDETSLTYLEAIVGPDFRDAVAHLERYEALCVGPEFNADGPVIVTLDPPPGQQ